MKNIVLYSIKGSEEQASAGTSIKNAAIRSLAGAISAGVRVAHNPIGKHTFISDIGVLFIGCEAGGNGKLSRPVRKVLKDIAPDGVKLAVFFTIAKSGAPLSSDDGKSILGAANIPVCEKEFRCTRESKSKKVKFPSDEDLQKAKAFAESIMSEYKSKT